jgi:hypothetical protein
MDRPGDARRLNFAQAPEPFESLMVRDFVLRPDGRLAVSAAGVLPGQGGVANLILQFDVADLKKPGVLINTGPVACQVLEASGATLWCLGPDMPALLRGQDYGILYRFEDGAAELVVALRRGQLPRGTAQTPWARPAQLLALPEGGVVAWMPGVERMAWVTADRVRIDELPWSPRPHAIVSAALDAEGRLHTLLPLEETEALHTRYGLFRRKGSEWERLAPDHSAPRGARLLAVRPGAALWLDRLSRLHAIPLPQEAER